MNPTQHGCRGGRPCLSALLNVFDDLMHLMSGGHTVDMGYLDFAKAFDNVDHGILLHTIKTLGITGVWLYHFLTHITQFCRLQGGISHASPVLSGVTQGTAPFYKMIWILYMIRLLVIICLLMPKNSNIYVLVLILHHLLTCIPVLVLI